MVNIEIDGKTYVVEEGLKIIEVADNIGIEIPRFCYHKKLSIAANCRMCLVEVEGIPNPVPACATQVTEGMKVFTQSYKTKQAQKAVMEFLLINHPLDCPICDQGGECELQDLALSYGQSCSRYNHEKRVVVDRDLGPLISSDMTRCIQCTRCVRFGEEIAGFKELGAMGRGESMQIDTFVQKSIESELSGNIIDLCPVGALTSKPFRFKARSWECVQIPSIAAHDCVGSNIYYHIYQDNVVRVAPRENEAVNEVWLSDRDRFSYQAFNSDDRLLAPMIKENDQWAQVPWEQALNSTIEAIKDICKKGGPQSFGAIAHPSSLVEEFYLLQQLMRAKGCNNIDHRVRALDVKHQAFASSFPNFGTTLEELEKADNILLIGEDARSDYPLLNHRIRLAALKGARVTAINVVDLAYNFPVAQKYVPEQSDILTALKGVTKALIVAHPDKAKELPEFITTLVSEVDLKKIDKEIAQSLLQGKNKNILLGQCALSHPNYSIIYCLVQAISILADMKIGELTLGANCAGAWIAGCLPHRGPIGKVITTSTGLSAHQMLEQKLSGYLLMNIEPEFDFVDPNLSISALENANKVIILTPFVTKAMQSYADILLPITSLAENEGTLINGQGIWQSLKPAIGHKGMAKPAWKVLRVMGNLLELDGFEYNTCEEVRNKIREPFKKALLERTINLQGILPKSIVRDTQKTDADKLIRIAPLSMYACDNVVRRSEALQKINDAKKSKLLYINKVDAEKLNIKTGNKVKVIQDKIESKSKFDICITDSVPNGSIMLAQGFEEVMDLGAPYMGVGLKLC